MNKAHLRALGRIFAANIDDAMTKRPVCLPFQSNAKVYRELEADGMVRSATVTVGLGWSAITVTGWELTVLGHLTYCMSCEDDPGHIHPDIL